eukprot:2124260-Rhodomonas_salina.2
MNYAQNLARQNGRTQQAVRGTSDERGACEGTFSATNGTRPYAQYKVAISYLSGCRSIPLTIV